MPDTIIIEATSIANPLLEAFKQGFENVASLETTKRFIKQADYEERLQDVVNTIVALTAEYSSIVTVDNVPYSKNEYRVPSQLIDLMSSGRVFGSPDAVGRAKPMFEVSRSRIKLTPTQFNKVFSDFNRNQTDGFKQLKLEQCAVRDDVTLEDVQYLNDGCGFMRKLHNNGFNIETCVLLGLNIPELSEFLPRYNEPQVGEVATWLFE